MATRHSTPDQQAKQPRQEKKDYYSQTVWVIVPCGIIGFFLSVFFLLGFSNDKRFHEIAIDFYKIDSTAADNIETILGKQKQEIAEYRSALKDQKLADPGEQDKKIDSIDATLYAIKLSRYDQAFTNIDTLAFANAKYSIRRDSLLAAIKRFINGKQADLNFGYYNAGYTKDILRVKSTITSQPFNSSYEFFNKYPSFAFWMFLGVVQMVIWWLIWPICISLYSKIDKLTIKEDAEEEASAGKKSERKRIKRMRWYKSFGLAGGAVIVFCLTLFAGVIGEFMIKDEFFMDGFRWRIGIYILIGYTVAILCFAGYLFIADFMHQLQNSYLSETDGLKQLNAKKQRTAKTEEAENQGLTGEINQQNEDIVLIKEKYGIAKRYFNLFLVMTAIVLSIVVLWIASLYNSINSMDVFKYYRQISGVNYLSGDFVYLFGGLNSLLLLIFFLPVKLNMFSAGIAIPQLQQSAELPDKAKAKEIAKNFGKSLGEILVIASPLLTSLLQNVLGSI